MRKNNSSVLLMDKLVELNELEVNKAKVLAEIFMRTTEEILDEKLHSIEINFKEQANFYGQNLDDYEEIYQEIIGKYEDQMMAIIDKYNEFFINMQLELQEAECNQKIAITNLKKSFDVKQELSNKAQSKIIEEYNKKVIACKQKKENYDKIIEACEKELNQCASNMERRMNALFGDKTRQISLEKESAFKRLIQRIKNKFTGTTKFNDFVIEPLKVELEMLEHKLPNTTNHIKKDTIKFVAKIKQAKDETNKIFENTING